MAIPSSVGSAAALTWRVHLRPERDVSGSCSLTDLRLSTSTNTAFAAQERPELKTLSRAEREARKVFAAQEAENALSDYEVAQRAFHTNREPVKAERLTRNRSALA